MAALHGAVQRLCDVLEAENAALAGLEFRRVGLFQHDKEAAMAALNSLAAATTDPTIAADRLLGNRLRQLAAENRRLLEQAILVQRRIMAVLAEAARTAQSPVGYGSKGRQPCHGASRAVALITRA